MKRLNWKWSIAIAIVGALGAEPALAHSGGLDAYGCHKNRKTGEYHCHRTGAERPNTGESQGQVTITDGDSLEMRGRRIRLHGVDAVESDQTCGRPDGKRWPCGRQAAFALADFIARQPVTCVHHGQDSYGRTLATCSVPSGSINDWLVRQGWAVAYRRYSTKYVEAELEARGARRNIWSGKFTNPERYRHSKRN
jgi:endonuclease YncB( thermonuclease family)